MKQLRLILAIVILSSIGAMTFAQTGAPKATLKSETFKVSGECEMCKSRIEKAVKMDGVTSADWVVKTKMLTVTFDPTKTNLEVIGKKLASVGHDSEKYKSSDDAYAKLPGCCHYEREK